MWNSQIVEELSLRQMPYEQRKWLLSLIAANKNSVPERSIGKREIFVKSINVCNGKFVTISSPSIARHQQRVQKSILARFECRHTTARLQIHEVDVHSIA